MHLAPRHAEASKWSSAFNAGLTMSNCGLAASQLQCTRSWVETPKISLPPWPSPASNAWSHHRHNRGISNNYTIGKSRGKMPNVHPKVAPEIGLLGRATSMMRPAMGHGAPEAVVWKKAVSKGAPCPVTISHHQQTSPTDNSCHCGWHEFRNQVVWCLIGSFIMVVKQ